MKKFLTIVASATMLAGVLLAAPSTASAASSKYDWYVNSSARSVSPGWGMSCANADSNDLQDVLDDANYGDTIYICAGIYIGPFDVNDSVVLVGAGSNQTYLDGGYDGYYNDGCNGNGNSTLFVTDEYLTVRNLTFRNGCSDDNWGHDGGAVNVQGGGDFYCYNSKFEDNAASNRGGAVIADYVYLNGCSFIHNYAYADYSMDEGNGEGGGAILANRVVAVKSTFTDNGTDARGGGIYVYDSYDVKTSTFTNNSAIWGGALYSIGDSYSQYISSSKFISNDALQFGGAILNDGAGYLWIAGSAFIGNTVCYEGCDGDGFGGAIFTYSNLTVVRSSFTNNFSEGYGSAIYSFDDCCSHELRLVSVDLRGNYGGHSTIDICHDDYWLTRVRFFNNGDDVNLEDC